MTRGNQSRRGAFGLLAFLAMAAGGCSGATSLPSLGSIALPAAVPAPPEPAEKVKPPPSQLLAGSPSLDRPPAEIYTLVARGALNCWFGATGPLKQSHIFNADAPPPSTGGNIDIAVHERDPTQPSPRGARAFQILLANESGGTRLSMRNNKLPADLAEAMERDTLAWADGKASCAAQVVRPPPPPEPIKAKPKKKSRA